MLDQNRQWGLADRPVVADAGYGDITAFRLGLVRQPHSVILGVS
jgi:hypothetical protein